MRACQSRNTILVLDDQGREVYQVSEIELLSGHPPTELPPGQGLEVLEAIRRLRKAQREERERNDPVNQIASELQISREAAQKLTEGVRHQDLPAMLAELRSIGS